MQTQERPPHSTIVAPLRHLAMVTYAVAPERVRPHVSSRLGGLICWENYMPMARMAMYSKGIDLYVSPTADTRDTWQATIRHIACEGPMLRALGLPVCDEGHVSGRL